MFIVCMKGSTRSSNFLSPICSSPGWRRRGRGFPGGHGGPAPVPCPRPSHGRASDPRSGKGLPTWTPRPPWCRGPGRIEFLRLRESAFLNTGRRLEKSRRPPPGATYRAPCRSPCLGTGSGARGEPPFHPPGPTAHPWLDATAGPCFPKRPLSYSLEVALVPISVAEVFIDWEVHPRLL